MKNVFRHYKMYNTTYIKSKYFRDVFKRVIILTLLFVLPVSCQKIEQKDQEKIRDQSLYQILFIQYMESGVCLHSKKLSDTTASFQCYRSSRLLCRLDGLFDPAGQQYRSGESSSRYFAEINNLIDKYPSCTNAANLAKLNPGIYPTAASLVTEYKTNSVYNSTEKCPEPGAAEASSVVTQREYDLITSTRGLTGAQAILTGDTECSFALGLTDWERSVLTDYNNNIKIIRTECFYGPGIALSDCTAEEMNYAADFGF